MLESSPAFEVRPEGRVGLQRVAVIGLGYIGLPTAATMAAAGLEVQGVDVNEATVAAINAGRAPFVEPDLEDLVAHEVRRGTLRAATTAEPADAFVIAVPTPFGPDRTPDLSFIEAACRSLAPLLTGGELVVVESTSPPGATRQAASWVLEERPDLSLDGEGGRPTVHFAHCPERVLPGKVLMELVNNDRVVGGVTRRAAELARDLYATFCRGQILLTDDVTAEMVKLVENSYRDVNIAFANELSTVCEAVGVNVWELIRLANHHPRVNILQPGPGVGGHCIAVDPWFIVDAAPQQARLIKMAREVNDAKPDWVLEQVRRELPGVSRPTIAALGLSFKPDIDDLRESPARRIVARLAEEYPAGRILAVEPHIDALPADLAALPNVELSGLTPAVAAADVVVLLVDHSAFGRMDRTGSARLVDTRGAWTGGLGTLEGER